MKSAQKKTAVELRMSSAEFDRIMGRALQVKPETTKPKSVKKKTGPKKSPARSK